MAELKFDANEVEPSLGFEPLPEDDYELVITESEMRQNKTSDGSHLALTFEVSRGECVGRKLFINLNLNNPNQKAVDIARRELSAICRAVGVMRVQDSFQLHNIPFRAHVGLRKRRDTNEMENRITKYYEAGESRTRETQKTEERSAPSDDPFSRGGGSDW